MYTYGCEFEIPPCEEDSSGSGGGGGGGGGGGDSGSGPGNGRRYLGGWPGWGGWPGDDPDDESEDQPDDPPEDNKDNPWNFDFGGVIDCIIDQAIFLEYYHDDLHDDNLDLPPGPASPPANTITTSLESWKNRVTNIRQFRDEYMMQNEQGRELIDMYYRNGREMFAILMHDSRIRSSTLELVDSYGDILCDENRRENWQIDAGDVEKFSAILEAVSTYGSEKLKRDIALLEKTVDEAAGRLFEEVYSEMGENIVTEKERSPENRTLVLYPNRPNPFNPITTISYVLPKRESVMLSIYDVSGKLVDNLVNEVEEAGQHDVVWDASGVASGVYFYRITTPSGTFTRKLVVLK
jgi:hypothetical protein